MSNIDFKSSDILDNDENLLRDLNNLASENWGLTGTLSGIHHRKNTVEPHVVIDGNLNMEDLMCLSPPLPDDQLADKTSFLEETPPPFSKSGRINEDGELPRLQTRKSSGRQQQFENTGEVISNPEENNSHGSDYNYYNYFHTQYSHESGYHNPRQLHQLPKTQFGKVAHSRTSTSTLLTTSSVDVYEVSELNPQNSATSLEQKDIHPGGFKNFDEFVIQDKKKSLIVDKQVAYKHVCKKTEICTNWMLVGNCTYGNKCHFAHGKEDLKPRLRVENYKTQPCCDPARQGARKCAYSRRCNYCHPGEGIRRPHPSPYFDKDYFQTIQEDFGNIEFPFGIYV